MVIASSLASMPTWMRIGRQDGSAFESAAGTPGCMCLFRGVHSSSGRAVRAFRALARHRRVRVAPLTRLADSSVATSVWHDQQLGQRNLKSTSACETRSAQHSSQVKAVEGHHLGPRLHEVVHKDLLSLGGRIDLRVPQASCKRLDARDWRPANATAGFAFGLRRGVTSAARSCLRQPTASDARSLQRRSAAFWCTKKPRCGCQDRSCLARGSEQ